MKTTTAHNLDETAVIAGELLGTLKEGNCATVVALSGDLGSGKTAFTKEAGALLGIPREEITSPTFVIMKIFDIDDSRFEKFIHIDAYRLEFEKELINLGWNEMIADSKNLIFIEWPEMVKEIIPTGAIKIRFESIDEDTRTITIS